MKHEGKSNRRDANSRAKGEDKCIELKEGATSFVYREC